LEKKGYRNMVTAKCPLRAINLKTISKLDTSHSKIYKTQAIPGIKQETGKRESVFWALSKHAHPLLD
jgi:hypothetical protein